MKFLKTFVIALLLTGVRAQAEYVSNIRLNMSPGFYSAGKQLTHHFGNSVYVERLLLSMEGGNNSFSNVLVYADGDLVANLGIPGRDPDYPVVIRKNISTIKLTFQTSARLVAATAYLRSGPKANWSVNTGSVAENADLLEDVVEELQEYASYEEFQTYLKPIRRTALRLAASVGGRGETSVMSADKARAVINAINCAEKYIDRLMDNSTFTPMSQALLTVKESLNDQYDLNIGNNCVRD